MTGYADRIAFVRCRRHAFRDSTETVLCGLEFSVSRGEKIAILGSNGSGKTTLLLHLMGLLPCTEGRIEVFGYDPRKDFGKIRRRIGVVFQRSDEQLIAPRVWDDVAFTLSNNGVGQEEIFSRVSAALHDVGIFHLKDRIIHYLSGGERKKVALAGALVTRPELLILDEPFNDLDPMSREEFSELILRCNNEYGTALVTSLHDVNLVPRIADKVYVMNKGHIAGQGSPREIFDDPQLLRRSRLLPPLLVELSANLQERGLPLKAPLSVADAADEIKALFEGSSSVDEK